MIKVRKSEDRGHVSHGWLDTYHTFSFSSYYDPQFTGFRELLVINDDRIAAGEGFGKHGHRDMEIITYVLDGSLEHKDSMGTGSVLKYGDVQRMSAGTGVLHSEFNHSKKDPLHLLQIWVTPGAEGIRPSYEEKRFSPEDKKNRLKLIVSPDGRDGSLTMHQNVSLYASVLEEGKATDLSLKSGRYAWVHVARGVVEFNGVVLEEGDGAAVSEEQKLKFQAKTPAEFLVFDLP
ncbi:MAG: pirin family protein [Oligoflexia bacterium]|nr:pirin family protein [Oligoflexia bacterium]